MRVLTPQVSLHTNEHTGKNEPVLSAHIHPHIPTILATAGGDNAVRLWVANVTTLMKVVDDPDNNSVDAGLKHLCAFTGHTKSVNCIRFSPCGNFLASASDDGLIIVYRLVEGKYFWDFFVPETNANPIHSCFCVECTYSLSIQFKFTRYLLKNTNTHPTNPPLRHDVAQD